MTDKHTPKIFFFIVPVLAALFTIIVVELFLRFFFPVPYSMEYNMYFIPDPYTGFRLRPHSIGYFSDNISGSVNSYGLRGNEIKLKKDEGVFRILVVGDSYTFGVNVRQEEAYPQVLERILNERSKAKVEVINAGTGGWDPFHYTQYCIY